MDASGISAGKDLPGAQSFGFRISFLAWNSGAPELPAYEAHGMFQNEVRKCVTVGSTIYGDSLAAYVGLDNEYTRQRVEHAVEYVRGRVHTNGMENFWSLLKRTVNGTYVAISPVHLQRYLDEQTFRFNQRKTTDGARFDQMMQGVPGLRLTYAELTGECLEETE